jgi:hypothetical protein
MSKWNSFAQPIWAKLNIDGTECRELVLAWSPIYEQQIRPSDPLQIVGIGYLTDRGDIVNFGDQHVIWETLR